MTTSNRKQGGWVEGEDTTTYADMVSGVKKRFRQNWGAGPPKVFQS